MSEWMGAEDHVNKALEHYERGRWADAEAELRKALASEPDRGEWQFNLGLTLEAAGRPVEAFDCYSRAVELMPEEADPLLAAGTIANRLGRHDEALGLMERAVRLRREDDTAHAVWIDSLVCLGRLDEAETVFHLARQSMDECPRSLAAVAEALIRRGQLARAEWCLREAMRLEPGLPRVRARLAAVVAEHGGVERAVQLYLRELRDDPGAIDTQLDFADLLLRLGRLPEASERYRRVLELEPANVDAHHGLGRVAIRTGRFDQAILELELVVKLDGTTPQVRLDLADALLGQAYGPGLGTGLGWGPGSGPGSGLRPGAAPSTGMAAGAGPGFGTDPSTDDAQARIAEAAAKLMEELELLRAGECETDRPRLGMLLLRAGRPGDAIPLLEEVAAAMADGSQETGPSGSESPSGSGSPSGARSTDDSLHGIDGAPGGLPEADGGTSRRFRPRGLEQGRAERSAKAESNSDGPSRKDVVGGESRRSDRREGSGARPRDEESAVDAAPGRAESNGGAAGGPPGSGSPASGRPVVGPLGSRHGGRRGGLMLTDVLRQLALAKFLAGDVPGGVRTSRRILAMDPSCVRSLHNLGLAMLRTGHPRRAAIYVAAGLRIDRHDDGLRRLRARVWARVWAQLARHVARSRSQAARSWLSRWIGWPRRGGHGAGR